MTLMERLRQPKTLVLLDVRKSLTAIFVTKVGFEALDLFGVVMAYIRLGLPNVRLSMPNEMTDIMTLIVERTDPPD